MSIDHSPRQRTVEVEKNHTNRNFLLGGVGVAALVVVGAGAFGLTNSTSNEAPVSSGNAGGSESSSLYEEYCANNSDKVIYDTSVSTMGYAGLAPNELIAEISASTEDSAEEWYSTTPMTMGDTQKAALAASVSTVINENSNASRYGFEMRASDPNDPGTHAWCLTD